MQPIDDQISFERLAPSSSLMRKKEENVKQKASIGKGRCAACHKDSSQNLGVAHVIQHASSPFNDLAPSLCKSTPRQDSTTIGLTHSTSRPFPAQFHNTHPPTETTTDIPALFKSGNHSKWRAVSSITVGFPYLFMSRMQLRLRLRCN